MSESVWKVYDFYDPEDDQRVVFSSRARTYDEAWAQASRTMTELGVEKYDADFGSYESVNQ